MVHTQETIRTMEELQLNNWPALQTLLVGGWVLRFADGYSKRSNSIQPLYSSAIPLDEKIAQCEQLYAARQLATVFKISPAAQPAHLDQLLEQKGYALVDHCSIQVRSLDDVKEPALAAVRIDTAATDDWLQHYCRLAHATGQQQTTMRRMFANLRTPAAFITLTCEDTVVACGIGVLERGYVGLWDIITDANWRNRGYGEQLLLHLLQWGKAQGAHSSYLVVVASNAPALKLYAKLGFEEMYQHWYRIKTFSP